MCPLSPKIATRLQRNGNVAKKRVFISYDYDNDKAAVDRLLEWDAKREIAFSSYDRALDVAVESEEAATIKQDLAARIANASHFLCVVGKRTYHSGWAAWATHKALELNKKVIAVKTDAINDSPSALRGIGASWSMMFNFNSIKQAIIDA
jgi:hypothetical protein